MEKILYSETTAHLYGEKENMLVMRPVGRIDYENTRFAGLAFYSHYSSGSC
ncbi:MAG: hypothetical protein K8R90_00450 [Candidatus Cloacimonetes bacterium]|nr:hypothetical protein [Candidatus Cloacimonadota bacterium]